MLFIFVVEYGEPSDIDKITGETSADKFLNVYPMFQDVHVMVYIGFGFLMVFLKTHCWTSVGFTFLIAAWAFQLGILTTHFWTIVFNNKWIPVTFNVETLIHGDFCAATCIITLGAVLGKADLFQCWALVTLECIFYGLNEAICKSVLEVNDLGGSIIIHTWGCYFGIMCASFFNPTRAIIDKEKRMVGGYTSQLIACIGTLFLYLYWPSFNAALAPPTSRERVVYNTALAMAGSTIAACATSRMIHFAMSMEIVLNATLAGGVAMASCTSMIVQPGMALLIGSSTGIVSALCFAYLGKFL